MREWGLLPPRGTRCGGVQSRNKRSVALDLRHADGQELVRALACASATWWSRTSARARWSTGASATRRCTSATRAASGPDLGLRADGRYRDRPGFAVGWRGDGRPPLHQRLPARRRRARASRSATRSRRMSAFQGVLLALYGRDARGASGQVVDASIAEACFAMLERRSRSTSSGDVREPSGSIIRGSRRRTSTAPATTLGGDRGQRRRALPAAGGADRPA